MLTRGRLFLVTFVVVLSALAVLLLIDWDPERTRREAFVHRCNEEGAGGMFTSRDYCEALYDRSRGRGAKAGRGQ